jgi:hypothetical protein
VGVDVVWLCMDIWHFSYLNAMICSSPAYSIKKICGINAKREWDGNVEGDKDNECNC